MRARRAKLFSPLARAGGLLALAALVWLAVRNAAIALFAQVQPSFALALPPPSGESLAIQALRGPFAPERQQSAAAEALARSPISYWPIFAAAEAALGQGDETRGAALLEEAVRRNSRQAGTRGRLFQLYIAEGRWSEAIDEGLAYARLRDSMSDSVMEAFLLLLGDLRGSAILARKLRARTDGSLPPWRERLARLSVDRFGERQLAALLSRPEIPVRVRGPAALSADGYISWVGSLPDEALPHVRGVYDGEFRGLPGAPPFGWRLARGARIEPIERSPSGALVVRAGEGQVGTMARQILVLSPGSHRFAIKAGARQGGRMAWRISCLTGATLAEIPIPAGDPDPAERSFTVPAGCAFQELALVASSAGGASRTLRVAVRPGP